MTLSYPMLQSKAWRSLSGAACKTWLELRTRYDGGNNGRLKLSLDEAARLLGLGKATVQRALAELVDKGFVTMTTRGQWYGRQASTWSTADKGVNGAMPTYAWKAWQPPPKKRPLGSLLEPAEGMTVPWQNRGDAFGSVPEPVSMVAAPSIGSQAERYYYHGGGGEGGRKAEAQSIASPALAVMPAVVIEARKLRRWSGRRLAAEAGVPYGSLAAFEAGRNSLAADHAAKVAAALGFAEVHFAFTNGDEQP